MAIAEVCFVLNGERVSLHGIDPGTTLSEWIRCSAGLTGTKTMCAEGGCGCCVVTGKWKDLASADGLFVTAAVNSVSFVCTAAVAGGSCMSGTSGAVAPLPTE